LLILDGWGIAKNNNGDAISAAKTPHYHELLQKFPHSELNASGEYVGLPPGLMGNSEVGHLNIGAGRVVVQKLTLISQSIIDGSFFKNPVMLKAAQIAKTNNSTFHILGLVSDGCVHSSPDHLDGILEFAKQQGINKLVVHPILDGRDTPPKSAKRFMRELEEKLKKLSTESGGNINCSVGVVCGRYYAMDRDNRWDRIEKYWRALVLGEGKHAKSAVEAVEQGYESGTSDEFILPTLITEHLIKSGDSVICFNFRPDRVRQISRALTKEDFNGFERPSFPHIYYACLTEYDASLNLPVAFTPDQLPSQDLSLTLPEVLACHHIPQFHAAETEKYAHVTYFLNGGKEAANEGEERFLIPSKKVATYDLAPDMQTPMVTDLACKTIASGKFPFIVLNLANPDMVGHTGILDAAVEAVESVDEAFAKLLESTRENKGTLFITADHGNVEQMIDPNTNEPHTAHTTNPVPFIVADFSGRIPTGSYLCNGSLADVAPTILNVMGIEKPKEMTGNSLLRRNGKI
jgi:2,3-bisphosphoglycerate-independent phosphoglycerate mutase